MTPPSAADAAAADRPCAVSAAMAGVCGARWYRLPKSLVRAANPAKPLPWRLSRP